MMERLRRTGRREALEQSADHCKGRGEEAGGGEGRGRGAAFRWTQGQACVA